MGMMETGRGAAAESHCRARVNVRGAGVSTGICDTVIGPLAASRIHSPVSGLLVLLSWNSTRRRGGALGGADEAGLEVVLEPVGVASDVQGDGVLEDTVQDGGGDDSCRSSGCW